MKRQLIRISIVAALATAVFTGYTAGAQSADPGWPRLFKNGKQQLTVYQPQVDYWNGYTNLHFRCAIAIKDSTPVIFITAHDEPEMRAQALGCGCVAYFRKTDPGEKVLDAIRHATKSERGRHGSTGKP